MFVVHAAGYVILAVIMAIGGCAGLLSAWLLKRALGLRSRPILSALSGALGSWIGVYLSFLNYSLYEEWYDGRLVSRHEGGLAHYSIIISIGCSVVLTVVITAATHRWVGKGEPKD